MAQNSEKLGFDLDAAVEALTALSHISGLDVALISPSRQTASPKSLDELDSNKGSSFSVAMHFNTKGCLKTCPRCCEEEGAYWDEKCTKTHVSASMLADRYGGKYIYICPENLIFIAAPIIRKQNLQAAMILGPADVSEEDETPRTFPGLEPFQQRNSQTFHELALLLSALSASLSDGQQSYLRRVGEEGKKGRDKLGASIKNSVKLHQKEYPISSEGALFKAITNASLADARASLDNIFVYFSTYGANHSNYLDQERIDELVTIISHAAIDGGVDSNIIFSAAEQCKKELRYVSTTTQALRRIHFFVEEAIGFVLSLHKLSFDDQIYRIQLYVQTHLSEEIRLEQMASYIGFSPAYLSRFFKEKTGINFITYVNQVRIEASKMALSTTNQSIAEIAQRCGFESVSYFARVFKKITGVTPRYYRQHRRQMPKR